MRHRRHKATVRHKIIATPLVAATGFIVLVGILMLASFQTGRMIDLLSSRFFPALDVANRLEDNIVAMHNYFKDAATVGDADLVAGADSVFKEINNLLTSEPAYNGLGQKVSTTYVERITEYYDLARSTTLRMIEGEFDDELFANAAYMNEMYEILRNDLQAQTIQSFDMMTARFEHVKHIRQKLNLAVTISVIVILGLIAILSVGLTIVIMRPIQDLTAATEAVAAGDLSKKISFKSDDEFGILAESFRKMQQNLIADIEAREEAQERLQISEERLALAFDAANDGIWDYHVETDDYYLSPRYTSLLGYDPEELPTSSSGMADLTHPDDQRFSNKELVEFVERQPEFELEKRLRHKNGEYIWFRVRGKVVERDERGRPHRIVGTHSDITKRKQAEEELKIAQQKLVEQAHSAGMAEIATSVLHNVGNVLNAATTSSTVIRETLKKSKLNTLTKLAQVVKQNEENFASYIKNDPQGQKFAGFMTELTRVLDGERTRLLSEINTLGQSHEHIRQIIAVQQNYAGVAGVQETVVMRELVQDAVKLLDASFERHHIDFKVEEPKRLPPVEIEKHRVLQIMINLLKNARDSVRDSGRQERIIRARLLGDGVREVKVEVTDNGRGISEEDQDKIFRYGFTTKKDGHGYGLHGCAIAIREMGGSLTFSSEGPDKGATFSFTLPIE